MWGCISRLFKKPKVKLADPDEYPAHVQIAMKELGVSEIYGPKHNPRIIEYHDSVTKKFKDDETPWCASFVCWCLEQAGIESTDSAWAKDFLNWGVEIEDPEIGCLAIFHRGSRNQFGHVGIFMGMRKGKIMLLNGNVGNKVCISYYSKAKLIGFRQPPKGV